MEKGLASGSEDAYVSFDDLVNRIRTCTRCVLSSSRTQAVVGDGPLDSCVMLVGEAPGKEEDLRGLPFVGRSGQLLTEMLESVGLRRKEVYITNVVKCRPPGNRSPLDEEIRACLPHLVAQIGFIKPRVIVALGSVASNALTSGVVRLTRDHGKWRKDYNLTDDKIDLFVTFHPSAALRNPVWSRCMAEDFRLLKKGLDAFCDRVVPLSFWSNRGGGNVK
ncbi:MAG: uracil-DNA glycosylase [Methanobacteriota archaeon]|nr:MAG: uracil-DNA glycosylase [Euryarchaeota archaeon]